MLHNLFSPLGDEFLFFNLFRYLTFRSGAATMTALAIAFFIGPHVIDLLKSKQGEGQPIRENGPQSHLLIKRGTPTMGGSFILLALTASTLLWADLTNGYVWVVLLVTAGIGLIGFTDDYLKLTKRSHRGLSGWLRLGIEFAIAAVAFVWVYYLTGAPLATSLAVPIFKDLLIDCGWFYIVFACFIVVGTSNAVNLTDGLDGLAIVPVMLAAACFGFIAYLVGNSIFSQYLQLNYVPGTGELAVVCGAMIGAGLGFLWYNAPPAMVFMGDTGSLSIGAALGTIAVITKHEIVLGIVGGLFVLEAVSTVIQVASFKLTGKRVFRMAPLHHHFEQKGWAEPTIVIRFWIIACVLAMIGLATLKLR